LFNTFKEGTMPAVTRAARNSSRRFVTTIPTPRRFLRCVACGTIKKERSYALCSECYKLNGQLDRGLFTCFARRAERETPEYSYRRHPEFEKACRIYARRQQRAQALAAVDAALPRYVPRFSDPRDRYQHEQYDGIGSHDLDDVLDWQMYGLDLPELDRSEHRELSDAEIERWDARVDEWAKARGTSLVDEPAPELRPWGYWMQIDGAMVWTDDAG
jgi:hypothetical protein